MADCSELAQLMDDVARAHMEDPSVQNLDDVLARMQQDLPQLTRDVLVDAINEVTGSRARILTELQKKIARIRREATDQPKLIAAADALAEHLANETLPDPKKRAAPPKVIAALRKVRDELRKQLRNSAPAQRQRLEADIAGLTEQLKTGNFLRRNQPAKLDTPELRKMRYKAARLRYEIARRLHLLKPRPVWQKVADPFNFIRTIMTSYDVSAVLRQGLFVAIAHPVRATKAAGAMFKALASEQAGWEIMNEIDSRPNAPLYARYKLFFGRLDDVLSQHEEFFMSKLAERIPGVRASERAYVTFLNKLRADSFDAMAASLARNGELTAREGKAIADFVNMATGRGGLGAFNTSAEGLNTVFFAPRYVASRFQMLALRPLWGGSRATRKMIAGEYARFLIGMSVVYMLAQLAGWDIELDPRSPDFGKVKIGNTRIDMLGGMGQAVVLMSRLVTGDTKSSTTGEITKIRGEDVGFGGRRVFDVMATFTRTKLSPMFATVVDVLEGQNVVGEPVTLAGIAWQSLTPLSLSEVYDAVREQGVAKGSAMSMVALFGAGMQTYGRVKLETPADAGKILYSLSPEKPPTPGRANRYREILADNEVDLAQARAALEAYMTERYGPSKNYAARKARIRSINDRMARLRQRWSDANAPQ